MKIIYITIILILFVFSVNLNAQVANSNVSGIVQLMNAIDASSADPNAFSQKRDQEFIDLTRGNEGDIERLYKMAVDANDTSAIKALAALPNNRSADALVGIIQRGNSVAGSTALRVLSKMPTEIASPRLISLLSAQASQEQTRKMIITYLREHPGENAEKALIRQADDSNLRNVVFSTLGFIGTTNSLDILRYFAENGTGSVQGISKHSMDRIMARMEGRDLEEEGVNVPFTIYQQAAGDIRHSAGEIRLDMKKEKATLAQQGRMPEWSANEEQEYRARVNALAKNTMAEKHEEEGRVSHVTDVEIANASRLAEEKQHVRAKVEAAGAQLLQVKQQAMQSDKVKAVSREYEQLLQAKMMEIDPQNELNILDEKDKLMVKEQALADPLIKQADERMQKAILDAMNEINPNTQVMIKELGEQVEQYMKMSASKGPQPLAPTFAPE